MVSARIPTTEIQSRRDGNYVELLHWKGYDRRYKSQAAAYEMNFLFVCIWVQRKRWHEICFCMHVHAAECSGMKFISVCMQVRRNAAKCKSFMCVCERGENDKILMNTYFIEFSNLIYTNWGLLCWVLWEFCDFLKLLRNEIQIQIVTHACHSCVYHRHGGWFNFLGILDERFIPLASQRCCVLWISNHGWTS